MNSRMNDNRGMALPLVILVSVFLMIGGVAMLSTQLSEVKFKEYDENAMEAYYLAKSAANAIVDHFVSSPEEALTLMGKDAAWQELANGRVRVAVSPIESEMVTVTAVGEVQNQSRTVVATLRYVENRGYEIFNYPIYSASYFYNRNNPTFDFTGTDGKIGIYLDEGETLEDVLEIDGAPVILPDGIVMDETNYDDYIEVMEENIYHTIAPPVAVADDPDLSTTVASNMEYIIKKYPNGRIRAEYGGVLTFDSDDFQEGDLYTENTLFFDSLTVRSNADLRVKIPHDTTLKIVANTVSISSRLEVITLDDAGNPIDIDYDNNPSGYLDGVLELYITESFDFETGGSLVVNDPNAFLLIMDEETVFTKVNSGDFKGFIYGPEADINILQNGIFEGAIISDNISFKNNPDFVYDDLFKSSVLYDLFELEFDEPEMIITFVMNQWR